MLERKKPLTRKKPLRPGKKALGRSAWHKKPAAETNSSDDSDADKKRRALRTDAKTRAHAAVWPLLCDGVRGFTFREHERLGPVIADFFCPAAKLVLEIVESAEETASHAWFAAEGYRVLSFEAEALAGNPQQALDAITDSFTLRVISRNA